MSSVSGSRKSYKHKNHDIHTLFPKRGGFKNFGKISVVEDQKILILRGVVLWGFREFLGGMKNQYDHSIKNNYSDML